MRVLFLLLTTLLFARENPFQAVVTNENNNLIKKRFFNSKKLNLPSDARILKSVVFKYQTLTGKIKEIEYPINQSIDWHNPLELKTKTKQQHSKNIKVAFLEFNIKNHTMFINSKHKIIRKFLLVKPFRYVMDFRANKNFLTYHKTLSSFIKKIIVGNHKGFYRVVLYLDGEYKTEVKKQKKGYLIEFK